MSRTSWDDNYRTNGRIWGDKPSELAAVALKYLRESKLSNRCFGMLDVGCGYGRDAIYLSKHLDCRILAFDISEEAVGMARNAAYDLEIENVDFECCDFTELEVGKYDVVFVSNLYHLLREDERELLQVKIGELLKPGGLLFLNTLSANDPEEYGKGVPIPHEPHSFQGKKYRHFSTGEELKKDFRFMTIKELYEYSYDEYHATGSTHRHISWILIGEFGQ